MTLIIFEGTDCSGKTAIHKAFDKFHKYKYLTLERLFATYYAYAKRYNREIDYRQLAHYEDILDEETYIVYLYASTDELEKRRIALNHEEVDFDKDKSLFEEFLKITNFNVISIDTTNKTPEEVVKKINEEAGL